MKKIFEITLPIKTISEANTSEHWSKRRKRHKEQAKWIMYGLKNALPVIVFPIGIQITRLSPRSLDAHDNLPMALKHITDSIADIILPGLAKGRADDDKRLIFTYEQEKSRSQNVKIEIFQFP